MATKLLLYASVLKIAIGDSTTWGYGDQEDWYKYHPECNADRDESPINILEENAIIDTKKCIPKFEWTIDETHNRFAVTNNGMTLMVTPVNEDNAKVHTPIATFPNYFHPTNRDLTYCLDSFHFHWGLHNNHGSEHQIDNKSYPLEVHFVHYSCEYNNVSEAFRAYANAQDDHILAVVAVLFEISDKDNQAFDIILSDEVVDSILFPDTTYVHNLRVNELIPPTLELNVSGYYYYEGSLTTPPCADVVRWNVMNHFGYVSDGQMERLRELMENKNASVAPNYREVQYNENDLFGCIRSDEGSESVSSEESGVRTIDIILIVVCVVLVIVLAFVIFAFCRMKKLFGVNDRNYKQLDQTL